MKTKDIRDNLDYAIDLAQRSGIKSFLTGAVIVRRDRRVTSGWSYLGTGWSHYSIRKMQNYGSIHAEIHALLRSPRDEIKGSSIFIATVRRKSGNIGIGRPCEKCLDLLYDVGIKDIYYTVEGQEWDYIKLV